jgi:hypothetical protein
MTYRYRFHSRGLALVVLVVAAVALAPPLGWGRGWIAGVGVTALALLLGASFLICERKRARLLGRLETDDQGVRRVRGDGRVVERMRWADVRGVVYDAQRRLLLLQGKDATGFCCSGPLPVGGVGLERLSGLLEEIGGRTGLPLTPAAGVAPRCPPASPKRSSSPPLDHPAASA